MLYLRNNGILAPDNRSIDVQTVTGNTMTYYDSAFSQVLVRNNSVDGRLPCHAEVGLYMSIHFPPLNEG